MQRAKPKRLSETAGPDPATPVREVRLRVGTVSGAHGVDGEVKVLLSTDDPEHLLRIRRLFIGDESQARRVISIRLHDRFALIQMRGISTPEAAASLRGQPVRIAGTDARPLEPGEFYLYQLVGLNVVDEAGAPIGTVTDIMETGANDVLIIAPTNGGPDILLPNHPQVVLSTDPVEGTMVVRPLVYDS